MKISLVTNAHGFDDFDVVGLPHVHRACVPHRIKPGERFNVYCADSVKLGATWKGSPERSLEHFAATHPGYAELCAKPAT